MPPMVQTNMSMFQKPSVKLVIVFPLAPGVGCSLLVVIERYVRCVVEIALALAAPGPYHDADENHQQHGGPQTMEKRYIQLSICAP